jgi:hypothetical protein
MLGVFTEFETNLRRERQLEGIVDANLAFLSELHQHSPDLGIDLGDIVRSEMAATKPQRHRTIEALVLPCYGAVEPPGCCSIIRP